MSAESNSSVVVATLVYLVTVVSSLGACAPSGAEVRTARDARYSCERGPVLRAVHEAMKAQLGAVALVDEQRGVVVSMPSRRDESGARRGSGYPSATTGELSFSMMVTVQATAVGLQVIATPIVHSIAAGGAGSRVLSPADADWPEWADANADALLVGVHERLRGCVAGVN